MFAGATPRLSCKRGNLSITRLLSQRAYPTRHRCCKSDGSFYKRHLSYTMHYCLRLTTSCAPTLLRGSQGWIIRRHSPAWGRRDWHSWGDTSFHSPLLRHGVR